VKVQLEQIIAVCALLVATIAAAASAYQTYVINQEFSATTWPYVSFDTTSDTAIDAFTLGVRNVGLGPAIVRDTVVTVDGKPVGPGTTGNPVYTALENAIARSEAAEVKRHQHGLVHVSTSSLAGGDVLPAGSSLVLLHAQGPDIFSLVRALQPHFDLSLCYCSVLGRCWSRRLKDPVPEPHDVRTCRLQE
jgi:hypothetical protein